MPSLVGMVTGKEYEVEGAPGEVFARLTGGDPHTVLKLTDRGKEREVYVFRTHVAYVEEKPVYGRGSS
jgi:hypothetical protein